MGAADHHITSGIDGAGETGGAVAALAGTPRARPRVDWSNLSPLRLFFGPVFQREVRSTGRRRWTYVLRMIFPLGMLGIVTLAYMGMTQSLDHVGSSGVGGAARLQLLQRLAPQLATVIAWCQFAALTFLGPVLTGPCICDEKRNRTLSALMTTPMTSAQIILGMLTSRLVHVFIITLAAAPLLLAIRIFGGLEASIILSFTGIVLSAGLAGATIGLFFSIGSRTATSAATGAVLVLILQTAAPLAVLAYYAVHYNVPPPGWVYAVSPAMSMFGVTAGLFDGGGGPGAMGYQTLALLSTAINLTLATITVLISIVALRRVMLAQAAG
ncbi:MAG: ABC transporter permease subunit, partial [Phycisphaerales bacterium]|nr:ABC transporter permease subunit [Phycisphaerales bacterium]